MLVDTALPFALGDTYRGKDADSNLVNAHLLGMVYEMPYPGSTNSDKRPVGRQVKAIILRNEAGFALLPKRLGQLTRTAGYSLLTSVDGYTSVLYEKGFVVVDPFLPSAGVADDDLFWGIVEGPCTIISPSVGADFNGDIAAGAQLVAATGATTGNSTSGRVSNVTLPGQTGATSAFKAAANMVGWALSARTTGETAADILVHAHILF